MITNTYVILILQAKIAHEKFRSSRMEMHQRGRINLEAINSFAMMKLRMLFMNILQTVETFCLSQLIIEKCGW